MQFPNCKVNVLSFTLCVHFVGAFANVCAFLRLGHDLEFTGIHYSPASNDTNITSGNGSASPSSC